MSEIQESHIYGSLMKVMDDLFPETCYYLLDTEYLYVYFNSAHSELMKKVWGAEIKIGQPILSYTKDKKLEKKIRQAYDKALAGERIDETDVYPIQGSDLKIERSKYYRPWRNGDGDIIGRGITDIQLGNVLS